MPRQKKRPAAVDVQDLLEALPAATFLIDGQDCITHWSHQAEQLAGWTAADVVGRPWRFALGISEGPQAMPSGIAGAAEEQILIRHADGATRRLDFAISETSGIGLRGVVLHSARSGPGSAPRLDAARIQLLERVGAAESFDEALPDCVGLILDILGGCSSRTWRPADDGNSLVSDCIWQLDHSIVRSEGSELRRVHWGEGLAGRVWEQGRMLMTGPGDPDAAGFDESTLAETAYSFAFPVIAEQRVIAVLEFDSPEPFAEDSQSLPLLVGSVSKQLARMFERHEWNQERTRSAAIVDSTSDAVIARNLENVITHWNRGAERVYGYSAEEAVGQSVKLIIPPPLEQEEPEIYQVLSHGLRLEHFETVRRRKDGELIDVSITVSPLLDLTGRTTGMATIERDITRSKQREADLRRAMNTAEVAKKTQQQFMANVSHELRTPMNAIIGMVDLALGDALSPRIRDYLETARDSSRVMLSLVEDLLDYSRMEIGRFELESDPFSVRRVLSSAMRSLSLRAFESGLELLCDVDSGVPDRLVGDARRFRQVVTNLTGNALKFTDEGEVVVRLDLASREPDHVVLRLTVRDTGIGIAEDDQQRIFDAFTQVDASSTRRRSGSGLGLTISREIVERMGGRLALESKPSQGSTFVATLQFRVLSHHPNATEANVDQLQSLPVLVVDDNTTNRRLLAETLSGWSMHPSVASGPGAALKLVQQARATGHPYPLLIVDGAMPEMDGCGLIRTLEDRGWLGDAQVLMLSSAGKRALSESLADLPIAALLEKPVSQSMLLDAIMTALNGPPHRQEDVLGIRPTTEPLSVLVAEDTPANRKVVDAILERRGHRSQLVANGRQAVEKFRKGAYDAILMDVQMPQMDGLQATQAIRSLPQGRNVPIIAMTAHAMRGDRERCLQAGMNAYIPKPLVADDLLHVLEQSVQAVRRQQARPHQDPESEAIRMQTSGSPSACSSQPESQAVQAPVVNLAVARQRLGNDDRLLRDMAGFFIEDAPQLLHELTLGLEQGRMEVATRAAHSLKGLAANFDAGEVVRLAQGIEDESKGGEVRAAQSRLEVLSVEIDRVVDALKQNALG